MAQVETETTAQRRERLVDAVALAADVEAYGQAEAAVDAILAVLVRDGGLELAVPGPGTVHLRVRGGQLVLEWEES